MYTFKLIDLIFVKIMFCFFSLCFLQAEEREEAGPEMKMIKREQEEDHLDRAHCLTFWNPKWVFSPLMVGYIPSCGIVYFFSFLIILEKRETKCKGHRCVQLPTQFLCSDDLWEGLWESTQIKAKVWLMFVAPFEASSLGGIY